MGMRRAPGDRPSHPVLHACWSDGHQTRPWRPPVPPSAACALVRWASDAPMETARPTHCCIGQTVLSQLNVPSLPLPAMLATASQHPRPSSIPP
eukprot:364700-Chlamydomonas_euryale.AAC.11